MSHVLISPVILITVTLLALPACQSSSPPITVANQPVEAKFALAPPPPIDNKPVNTDIDQPVEEKLYIDMLLPATSERIEDLPSPTRVNINELNGIEQDEVDEPFIAGFG